ncbi:MAG: prepilin-type N-terminal cleavage/methylation domain-containing protein [Planctomycetaceae bacterium]
MRHLPAHIIPARRMLAGRPHRAGFTLVELLVVITIMLILLGITVAGINYSRTGDKVSSAARQVQSFLAGARDRAIHADEARGVRLFIEQSLGGSPAALRTVTTMAYIAPGGTWEAPRDSAKIQLERVDGNSDGDYEDAVDLVTIVRGFNNPGWWNLKRRGLLVDGMRIRIPAGPSGNWYPLTTGNATTNPTLDVTQPPPDQQLLLLQIPYADAGDAGQLVAHRDLTYEIELPTRMLPQDPSILPDGVVIDLDGSKVPSVWRPTAATGSVYSGYMDVMFSPRGSVIGDAAGVGVLHFAS